MLEPDSAVALVEQAKASVRAKVEHPFPEAEAAVRVLGGTLPGAGEEHGAAGIAVRAGQPVNCSGSTEGVVCLSAIFIGLRSPDKLPTAR